MVVNAILLSVKKYKFYRELSSAYRWLIFG